MCFVYSWYTHNMSKLFRKQQQRQLGSISYTRYSYNRHNGIMGVRSGPCGGWWTDPLRPMQLSANFLVDTCKYANKNGTMFHHALNSLTVVTVYLHSHLAATFRHISCVVNDSMFAILPRFSGTLCTMKLALKWNQFCFVVSKTALHSVNRRWDFL